MIQDILTYLIVLGALVAAGYKIYHVFPFKQSKGVTTKCTGCTTECVMKKYRKDTECSVI